MDTSNNNRHSFWQPWGAGGCLWRTIVFLLGIIALSFLMSLLLKGCDPKSDDDKNKDDKTELITDKDDPNYPDDPDNPYNRKKLPQPLQDDTVVDDWNDSIPGVKELPRPDDNFIPPIDSTRIVESPIDSLVQIVAGQLVVIFNSKDLKADMASFARQFKKLYPGRDYRVAYYSLGSGLMLLDVPDDQLVPVGENLADKIKDIDFLITTNDYVNTSYAPTDPGFKKPNYDEYYRLIQAYDAWDITRGSADVKVAIVDSYFDLTNPEIGRRYVDPINISTKRRDVLPPARRPRNEDEAGAFCHGSHVAGLAIGGQDNSLGCSGIAPECTWIPVALGDNAWTTLHVLEGVLYAIYHDADVINMSIQSTNAQMSLLPMDMQILFSENLRKGGENVWRYVVETAKAHNCVIVKAAGNFHVYLALDYMNRLPDQVVNVEAVDSKGQRANFSNFGIINAKGLHYSTVAAPGVNLLSVGDRRFTDPQGFMEMGGTSMSAPVVTGAVALLKSKKKDITAEEVIKVLRMTGKQTDTSGLIGPTIQIRDALDATGGELLNFEDLKNNHDLIIGKWKSTHELQQTDGAGNVNDLVWTYFIFTSSSAGFVEHHAINSKRVYKAPITVKWTSNDRMHITQNGAAVSADGDNIEPDIFDCHANKSKLLEAEVKTKGKTSFTFMLEKVK